MGVFTNSDMVNCIKIAESFPFDFELKVIQVAFIVPEKRKAIAVID